MNDLDRLLTSVTVELSATHKNDFKKLLATEINRMITADFSSVVQLLYRVDVDEAKLKQLLVENPSTDASDIIADLLIERQIQKQLSKQNFRNSSDISEAEKW